MSKQTRYDVRSGSPLTTAQRNRARQAALEAAGEGSFGERLQAQHEAEEPETADPFPDAHARVAAARVAAREAEQAKALAEQRAAINAGKVGTGLAAKLTQRSGTEPRSLAERLRERLGN